MEVEHDADAWDDVDDEEEDPAEILRLQMNNVNRYVRADNLHALDQMFSDGYNIHSTDSRGDTALHYAIRLAGKSTTVQYLLEHDADFTRLNNLQISPLMTAAGRGNVEIFSLIAAKFTHQTKYSSIVQLNSTRHVKTTGETLLMLACGKQPILKWNRESAMLVNMLLRAGFDPSVVDRKGWTALHHASESNRNDRIQTVLFILQTSRHNDLVHMKDNSGDTALHVACMNEYGDAMATFLLGYGSKVSDHNNKMETPLHISVRKQAVELATMICEYGADPLARDMLGRTSIHAALELPEDKTSFYQKTRHRSNKTSEMTWQVFQMLIDKCDHRYQSSYLECRDNLGMTPLLLACQQRNAYSVEKLLAIPRINADARDIDGNSVLHLCLTFGWYAAVCRLLDLGVYVQVHNKRGESPLWIAHDRCTQGWDYEQCRDILARRRSRSQQDSIAFAMAHNRRLGEHSLVNNLPEEVVEKITKRL
jgi:ankyrin repeat protein